MHTFLLEVGGRESRLVLKKDESAIGTRTWSESRDMGRQLFEAIQSLLVENGLKAAMIGDFRVQTDVSDNFTSVKIAQTVARVYTWSVSKQSPSKKR